MIVRTATVNDALALQGRLRRADYEEVWVAHGEDPDAILVNCVEHSSQAWAMEIDGNVEGVFGVASTRNPEEGCPWLLGTDALTRERKALLREPEKWLCVMHCRYPVLRNYVDARNTVSIRWLSRLGFIIEKEPVLLGPFQSEFYEFYREVEACAQSYPM